MPLFQILIDIETLLGLTSDPATLPDGTPLDAEIAREPAPGSQWQMILTELVDIMRELKAAEHADTAEPAEPAEPAEAEGGKDGAPEARSAEAGGEKAGAAEARSAEAGRGEPENLDGELGDGSGGCRVPDPLPPHPGPGPEHCGEAAVCRPPAAN